MTTTTTAYVPDTYEEQVNEAYNEIKWLHYLATEYCVATTGERKAGLEARMYEARQRLNAQPIAAAAEAQCKWDAEWVANHTAQPATAAKFEADVTAAIDCLINAQWEQYFIFPLNVRAEAYGRFDTARNWIADHAAPGVSVHGDDIRFMDGYEPPEPHYDQEPTQTLHGAQ